MVRLGRKETMTVAELREKLNEFPQDAAVFATWEGVLASFKAVNFALEEHGRDTPIECVVIDVEDYHS